LTSECGAEAQGLEALEVEGVALGEDAALGEAELDVCVGVEDIDFFGGGVDSVLLGHNDEEPVPDVGLEGTVKE